MCIYLYKIIYFILFPFSCRYRGAAHSECNLKLRYRFDTFNQNYYIPVVCHNLKSFDGQLILKGYKKSIFKRGKIQCVPSNMERFLSFSIDNLR